MGRRGRLGVRSIRLATVAALGAGLLATVAGPSSADVTAVTGSAYGFQATVSLFNGPPNQAGPTPTVTLPPGGSATPITATEPSGMAQFGPAVLFQSGQLTVSTQGTTGPGGTVTSSADVTGDPNGPGPFLYQAVHSECTASESGVSGATTITGGVVETSYDPNTQEPVTTEDVPASPAANLEITGTLDHVGDSFRIVFNEQITNPDGSLTVNGAHVYLLGPTAKGDLIIAQSVCGVTATSTPTTEPGVTTTVGPGVTTTVGPGVTTTVGPGVTTTVAPGATTTTRAPGATTTTVRRATTTTRAAAAPSDTSPPGKGPLVRTGSGPESLIVLGLLTLVVGALVLTGFGSRAIAAGEGPWAAVVRQVVVRRRNRRPWNRRRWS